MISFIIPYMDRPEHLPGCLHTIAENMSEEYEVIIAEQGDGVHFLRGQLVNLGASVARGDVLVVMDADCRFLEPMHFTQWLAETGGSVLPWAVIVQVAEPEVGRLVVLSRAPFPGGVGLLLAVTRERFDQACGYSNLPVGWGGEDHIISRRLGRPRKLDREIGHVQHRDRLDEMHKSSTHKENVLLNLTDARRDHSSDGIAQTLADCAGVEVLSERPRIERHTWTNITVPDDFPYRDLLKDYRRA